MNEPAHADSDDKIPDGPTVPGDSGGALPPLHMWLTEPLKADAKEAIDRLRRADDVAHLSVMPDVHPGEQACVGVAMATRRLVYPMAIGGDIGCGLTAAAVHVSSQALRDARTAERVLDQLRRSVPILRHNRRVVEAQLPESLDPRSLTDSALATEARRDGLLELGTLGRGNHFLELQEDACGQLWIMIHSGSRAMGQVITRHHSRHAVAMKWGMAALDLSTDAGRAYLQDLEWARRYARANRAAMLDATGQVLEQLLGSGLDRSTLIECDHNHARIERHGGQDLVVHRKGASSAESGERGLIPGSMGTASYHVTGRGCELALRSSSHGAGRLLSRGKARSKIRVDDLRRQMRGIHFDVRATSRLVEESPQAYKDIGAVMRAQRELVRIDRVLRPVLVYKGT
jgi:tRNA-splicing ligase RtcB